MEENTRKHDLSIEIAAPPEEVWKALSTGQGITTWFAPIAEVNGELGGTAKVSWGGGMEGTSRLEAWEPNKHVRWVYDRPSGGPPNVTDFYIEARGGTTVLRLVHSGFGPESSFDGEYESTGAAWPVFLKMLKHSAEHGVASCTNVTDFRFLEETRESAWAKISGPGGLPLDGNKLHSNPAGLCCVELPDRGGDLLTVMCEGCGGQTAVTVMMLLYGKPEQAVQAAREDLARRLDALFNKAATA